MVGIVFVGCLLHKPGDRMDEASAPPRRNRGFYVYVAVMGTTLVEVGSKAILRQTLD